MWNTTILPILTPLIATGLSILMVLLFNRKIQDDERANQISHIRNQIDDIRNRIINSIEHSELADARNKKFREDIRAEIKDLKSDIQGIKGDIQSIKGQVAENRGLIQN